MAFYIVVNYAGTIGLSFLLLRVPAIISSKMINSLRFLFGLYSSMFLKISSTTFEYPIKTLEPLKCFKPVLSRLLIKNWCFALYESLAYKQIWLVSGYWFIRLNNEFSKN